MFLILSSKKPVCFSCATGCWGKGHLSTHESEYLLSDQEHGLPPHWPPWRETSPRGKWVWKKNETFWSSATAVQRFSYRNELKRFGYLLQDSFPFIFLLLSSSAGPVFPAGLLLCYLPSHQAIADLFATEVRLFARLLLKQSSGQQPTLIVEGLHVHLKPMWHPCSGLFLTSLQKETYWCPARFLKCYLS